MVASMTAFARKALEDDGAHAVWEIRSVNHRFLDVTARLPDEFRVLELAVRDRIAAHLRRGKVDCLLRLEANHVDGANFTINTQLARRVASAAGTIAELIPDPSPVSPLEVLRWPGVIETSALDPEALSGALLALLDDALDALVDARTREGARLGEIIARRCADAHARLAAIRDQMPAIIEAVRDRYASRLLDLKGDFEPGRLEQELLLLVQKLDVAEELDRIDTHLTEISRVLELPGAIGRRLDFMVQELNREANTLASKSAHSRSSAAAVEMKVLVEQMREQIQNIE